MTITRELVDGKDMALIGAEKTSKEAAAEDQRFQKEKQCQHDGKALTGKSTDRKTSREESGNCNIGQIRDVFFLYYIACWSLI